MYAFLGSVLENQRATYGEWAAFFEERGFTVGGGWETDHGYFDKKLKDEPGYLFLRIPAFAEEGQFGDHGALLKLGTPFLLSHRYQRDIDSPASPSLMSATFNQFASPEDEDASLSEEDIEAGQAALREVEEDFNERFLPD